ncbi:MAG: metal-dependent hydrolase [Proteobacteria bacterium]|nr:metal-dependent hydrolase [Pseudomonadota bacterium]
MIKSSSNHQNLSRQFPEVSFKTAKISSRYWFNHSAVQTLHANALTTSIPYGERFFVSCVFASLKRLKNKTLKKKAIHFARQEIRHSKEHFRLYIKAVKPFYPKLKVKNYFYQNLFALVALVVGHKIRLAMVAAMEHFTAKAGEFYLSHPEFFQGVDATITSLWQWHFLEEVEHKAVVFDIFYAIGGNYIQRIAGYFLSAFFLITGFVSYFFHMVAYDKLYQSKQFYIDAFHFFWGEIGILRKLTLPFLSYLAPHFHPNQ